MDVQERLNLIFRGVDEVITEEELRTLLLRGGKTKSYVGLEPSGLMHIGTGLILGQKLKDFAEAGLDVTVLLADWHAYINDKLEGSLENIQICGEYFKDCFAALNIPKEVRFVYASELVDKKQYWQNVILVSKSASLARIKRALTIMGRKEEDADLDASKLIYPAMQVADIRELDLDLALGGMDQRHAHMLYRDLAPRLGWKKVVAVHTPLLAGLEGGGRMETIEAKMSKSNPDSCIFLQDSRKDIERKVGKAFCPQREIAGNPVVQICRYILFPNLGSLKVERETRYGGDVTFQSYPELEKAYTGGELHPQDLKSAVARNLDNLLGKVRSYFEKRPENYQRMREIVGI